MDLDEEEYKGKLLKIQQNDHFSGFKRKKKEQEENECVVGKENRGETRGLSLLSFSVGENEVGTSCIGCGLG